MPKSILIALVVAVISQGAFAGNPGNRVPTNPCPKQFPNIDQSCQAVCEACYEAKYVVGEWNQGDGFWADCVGPLVTGKKPPKATTNDGRELPVFPANMAPTGATCMAKNGKFWEKKK
jgi:hypothetical protein